MKLHPVQSLSHTDLILTDVPTGAVVTVSCDASWSPWNGDAAGAIVVDFGSLRPAVGFTCELDAISPHMAEALTIAKAIRFCRAKQLDVRLIKSDAKYVIDELKGRRPYSCLDTKHIIEYIRKNLGDTGLQWVPRGRNQSPDALARSRNYSRTQKPR